MIVIDSFIIRRYVGWLIKWVSDWVTECASEWVSRSVSQSVSQSVRQWCQSVAVCPFVNPSVYPSVRQSAGQSIHPAICQSVSQLARDSQSVSPSVCSSVNQSQGLKKVLSGRPRQLEDSPSKRVPFHSPLPNGQEIRQFICQLNHLKSKSKTCPAQAIFDHERNLRASWN